MGFKSKELRLLLAKYAWLDDLSNNQLDDEKLRMVQETDTWQRGEEGAKRFESEWGMNIYCGLYIFLST